MNSSNLHSFRGAFAATLAAAIVGTSGLALDKGHGTYLPKGTIEVGELTPLDVLPQATVLPEITVRATRLALASNAGRG